MFKICIIIFAILLTSSSSSQGTATMQVVVADKIIVEGSTLTISGEPYQLVLMNEGKNQKILVLDSERTAQTKSGHFTVIYP